MLIFSLCKVILYTRLFYVRDMVTSTVAMQCMEQVYKLNTTEEEFVRKYSISHNLLDIFNAHLNEVCTCVDL